MTSRGPGPRAPACRAPARGRRCRLRRGVRRLQPASVHVPGPAFRAAVTWLRTSLEETWLRLVAHRDRLQPDTRLGPMALHGGAQPVSELPPIADAGRRRIGPMRPTAGRPRPCSGRPSRRPRPPSSNGSSRPRWPSCRCSTAKCCCSSASRVSGRPRPPWCAASVPKRCASGSAAPGRCWPQRLEDARRPEAAIPREVTP